jgi:radical SAM-linked protein
MPAPPADRPAQIKIKFSKTKSMIYISHLDLMRLFQRALRRAEIPVVITKGFSPHLKIRITPALKLGQSSSDLEARIYLNKAMDRGEFKNRLQAQLPEGLEILETQIITD